MDLAVTFGRDPRPGSPQPAAASPASAAATSTEVTPAFEELFRAHARFVWRVAAALGVAASDVQDVTQEVFLVAFRRAADWDPARASARTWLYGITARVAANHRRLAHIRHERGGALPTGGSGLRVLPDPAGAIDRARLLARLDAALAQMEPARRDVFILFEIAELSMQEVAATVGCPLKTAYKRLYTARREVAARLGVAWGEARPDDPDDHDDRDPQDHEKAP